MQRIYLPNTQFSDVLEISEKQLYHQLTRVLRARVGQEVVFFDGKNLEDHLYAMIHIDKKSVSFKRKEIIPKSSELRLSGEGESGERFFMTLYQATPNKLGKFEYIVQKCSEIGYRKIVFFESERSQKLVLSDNKKERLNKIAIEATEQCSGNIIPEIEYYTHTIPSYNFLPRGRNEATEYTFICHTKGEDSLSLSDIKIENNINIIIGPEGGFSDEEVEKIEAQKIYFGSRILRCETVGEVVGFYLSQ